MSLALLNPRLYLAGNTIDDAGGNFSFSACARLVRHKAATAPANAGSSSSGDRN